MVSSGVFSLFFFFFPRSFVIFTHPPPFSKHLPSEFGDEELFWADVRLYFVP